MARIVLADDGIVFDGRTPEQGPLGGAVVDTTNSLVTLGSTTDPGASWAADPDRIALVGPTASATYVDTACVPSDVAFADGDEADLAPAPAGDLDDLDDLGFFSVSYGTELVTVRLGLARNDVFDRARLPETRRSGWWTTTATARTTW